MRRSTKQSRHHNLTKRGGVYYYHRILKGKRVRFSTKTKDLRVALAVLEEQERCESPSPAVSGVPTFGEFVKRYLEEDTDHLARTTLGDRRRELRETGPIVSFFGERPLDGIDPRLLREWWTEKVIQPGLTTKTGRNWLDCISGVFYYAQEVFESIEENPVDAFRRKLRRKNKSKKGRAESESGRHVRPIENPADVDLLVDAAREQGAEAYVQVLLQLDAGLRVSEAIGVTWGSVVWGVADDDTRRYPRVHQVR